MEWTYQDKEFNLEEHQGNFGFVYLITNLQSGKMYYGMKYLTKSKRKQVKGKIKKSRVESDWKDYWGSCQELLDDLQKIGPENFKREIILLCKTLGRLKYEEVKIQFLKNVLEEKLPNGEWKYYNANIAMKFTRRSIGVK